MKFSALNKDIEIQRIQQEIEDKLADSSDVEVKLSKTTAFKATQPELTMMEDGQEIAYDDGTDKWIYRRIGATLQKWQLTAVT